MEVKIKYLGQLADLTGNDQEIIQLENGFDTGKLVELIMSNHSVLRGQVFKIAVNQSLLIDENRVLSNRDEIALLPPYAGG